MDGTFLTCALLADAMDAPADTLPFIDAHTRVVAATPAQTWGALVRVLPRIVGRSGARRYARIVRAEPGVFDASFPAVGARLVAFRVMRADAPHTLSLVGRHRFASYALDFHLEAVDDGRATRLRADTRAAFPGFAGGAYRLAVIRSGGHAMATRSILRAIGRSAERRARAERSG